MIKITCPHCGATGSMTPPPKEFVIIAPCPQCGEWIVLFREKVVAISREILNNGTFEEKKQHVAEIITTFLDSLGPLPPALLGEQESTAPMTDDQEGAEGESVEPEQERPGGITKEEIRDFVSIDLKLIDKRDYFERVFGKLD